MEPTSPDSLPGTPIVDYNVNDAEVDNGVNGDAPSSASSPQPPLADVFANRLINDVADDDEDDGEPVDQSFLSMLDESEAESAGPGPNRHPADSTEPNSVDFYAILGVPRDANLLEIRAAYKRLSLLFHPDKHFVVEGKDTDIAGAGTNAGAVAQVTFGRIATAYSVLSDVNKRTIYDRYGYRGLQIDGWELAVREKSAAELRLEYLRIRQKYREAHQMKFTHPSSEFSMGVDMTDLFDRFLKEEPSERVLLPSLSVYEMVLRQSVTAGATLRTSTSLVGEVVANNGLGVGTCMLLCQHQIKSTSPIGPATLGTQLSYGRGGQGIGLGVNLNKSLSDRLSGHVAMHVTRTRVSGRHITFMPGAAVGLNFQLTPRCLATVQLRCVVNSGLSSDVVWSDASGANLVRVRGYLRPSGKHGISMHVERSLTTAWLSSPMPDVDGDATNADNEEAEAADGFDPTGATGGRDNGGHGADKHSKQGRVLMTLTANTIDVVGITVGLQCPVSSYSRLSGSITLSGTQGVSLQLQFLRGSQSYSMPIRLSEFPDPIAIGYGCLVPLLAFAVMRSLVYEPWLRRQLERAQLVRRRRLRGELVRRRQQALDTQALMQQAAARQRRAETAIDGLVIQRAVYGCLWPTGAARPSEAVAVAAAAAASFTVELSGPVFLDVTIPLQATVANSQLRLPPSRWSDLQGFYDPCLGLSQVPAAVATAAGQASSLRPDRQGSDGVSRQLYVRYRFQSAMHEVCVDESLGLAMPLAKHKLPAQT